MTHAEDDAKESFAFLC